MPDTNQIIIQGSEMALHVQSVATKLTAWVEYAESQLNGDESPAVVESIVTIKAGLAELQESIEHNIATLSGVMGMLKKAVEQRDQAESRAAQLEQDWDEAVEAAKSDEIQLMLQVDPFLRDQQLELYAEDIADRGLETVKADAEKELLEQLEQAQRMAERMAGNQPELWDGVYVDENDSEEED